MANIQFLDLSSQYLQIKDEIDLAISNVLSSASFVGGTHLESFEKNFASFTNTLHAVGVGNGTDALEIAIESLSLPLGSEIIVPSNSFIATSEAVTRSGHQVVFADVDPNTCNISIETILPHITANTKAIIAVHLYGFPAPMLDIVSFAKDRNLFVIEDCAQAHGSYIGNKHIGTFGDISSFSFYPGKNLGAYGDGGAIVTNSEALAFRSRLIANHGRISKYDHIEEGRNSRLDNLQAAILDVKLKYLPQWIKQRISNAQTYYDCLSSCPHLILPQVNPPSLTHSYHLFVIRVSDRNGLKKFLSSNNIPFGIHYPTALPLLPPYLHKHTYATNYFAVTAAEEILSLPVGEHLSSSDISYISQLILSYFH